MASFWVFYCAGTFFDWGPGECWLHVQGSPRRQELSSSAASKVLGLRQCPQVQDLFNTFQLEWGKWVLVSVQKHPVYAGSIGKTYLLALYHFPF